MLLENNFICTNKSGDRRPKSEVQKLNRLTPVSPTADSLFFFKGRRNFLKRSVNMGSNCIV